MPKYHQKIFSLLVSRIGSKAGVYSAIWRKEKKFKGSVSPEIIFLLVATEHSIKISKYIKEEQTLEKVYRLVTETKHINQPKVAKYKEEKQKVSDVDPFKISLSRFNIYPELSKECSIKKPYSKEINHAILILEVFMRNKMGLNESVYGVKLVDEAKKIGVFKKRLPAEEDGLNFLFRSAFLWLRNSGSHKKRQSEKEECLKIILFVDYLIKNFEELYDETQK